MPRKIDKLGKHDRPPRIRVPNQERALFTVDNQKFVGIVQRLSGTGGSALLVKGPIPEGTLGAMALSTVFGKVNAQIEFLHTGADGVPLAQAFRFLAMDAESSKRFNAAAEQMQSAGFGRRTETNTSRWGVRKLEEVTGQRPAAFGDAHLGATDEIESVTVHQAAWKYTREPFTGGVNMAHLLRVKLVSPGLWITRSVRQLP